jgi:hypothetical protein
MLEFPCTNCHTILSMNDDHPGGVVVCYNCNTRQVVPADAKKLDESAPEMPPAPTKFPWTANDRQSTPPTYELVNIAGVLLILVGIISCALAVVLAFTLSFGMLLGIVSGITTIGLGALLHLLRDIAIDVWHIRRRNV